MKTYIVKSYNEISTSTYCALPSESLANQLIKRLKKREHDNKELKFEITTRNMQEGQHISMKACYDPYFLTGVILEMAYCELAGDIRCRVLWDHNNSEGITLVDYLEPFEKAEAS